MKLDDGLLTTRDWTIDDDCLLALMILSCLCQALYNINLSSVFPTVMWLLRNQSRSISQGQGQQ